MTVGLDKCEYCGSPAHTWLFCPRKPPKWRPDRLKQPRAVIHSSTDGKIVSTAVLDAVPQETLAGNIFKPPTGSAKRGRGRPRTIEDMKAYKAQKARDRRARQKAEKGNGND